MKYVFDHYALQYMLEQFPRNIADELWGEFLEKCEDGVIVSHRESQKVFEQEAVEETSLEWSKQNGFLFKKTTEVEADLLGRMMKKGEFDFLETPRLVQRRLPEPIPFILCMAKIQDRVFVYRKNTNIDFFPKIRKICNDYEIQYMEIEECLVRLKKGK